MENIVENQIKNIIKNKKSITQNPGIYFLLDNNKIVYVGKSLSPEKRINSHISDKNFDSYSVIRCKECELNSLEKEYILKFLPKYNKHISLPGTNLSPIGKITRMKNGTISIPCLILNNKLYADLSKTGFKLIAMHSGEVK